MQKLSYLFIILFLIGILVAIDYSRGQKEVGTTRKPSVLTPGKQTVPTPAPIRPSYFDGTISTIKDTTLTINTKTGPKTISIANTYDIARVTSGDITTSNFQTKSIKKTDLKVGNKVHVVIDKNTGATVSVFIIK